MLKSELTKITHKNNVKPDDNLYSSKTSSPSQLSSLLFQTRFDRSELIDLRIELYKQHKMSAVPLKCKIIMIIIKKSILAVCVLTLYWDERVQCVILY